MGDLVLESDKALVFPSGSDASKHVVLDMTDVYRAEVRLVELKGVNRQRAGELVYTFIEAWDRAKQYLSTASIELLRAKQRVRNIRAAIVLDSSIEVLKKKELVSSRSPAGSEDLRESVVNSDPQFQEATERVYQIQAVVEILDSQVEKFRMAYFSINKLLDPYQPPPSISGGTGLDDVGAMTETEKVRDFTETRSNTKSYGSAFGTPKY
jgi:hypothetical protein